MNDEIKYKNKFREILQDPLMLVFYRGSCQLMRENIDNHYTNWKGNAETQGEIIWNFLEAQLCEKIFSYDDEKKIIYFDFVLKHIVPYIGYILEETRRDYINYGELGNVVREYLCEYLNKDFFKVFSEYVICKDEILIFDENLINQKIEIIIDLVLDDLEVMELENEKYIFIHKILIKYFAAKHILNRIKITNYFNMIPYILKDRALNYFILKFIGELDGEHYRNTERIKMYNENRGEIEKVLDIVRGKYDDKEVGYIVWNVVEILKIVREDLSGCDFSNLNFNQVRINGFKCSNKEKKKYAKFNSTKFNENTLLPYWSALLIEGVVVDNNKYAACSKDGLIMVGDINTKNYNFIKKAHFDYITAIDLKDDFLVTGSYDKSIKVWNVYSGECVRTIEGHSSFIEDLIIGKDKIISCSGDRIIKVWDLKSGECLNSFSGHQGTIKSLSNYEYLIASGSQDNSIKIWDIEAKKCVRTLVGHKEPVTAVIVENKLVLSGSDDMTVKIWDIESRRCKLTLIGHTASISSVAMTKSVIISASRDRTIKIWNLKSGCCIKTLKGHEDEITSIDIFDNNIISSGYDGKIKIWDIESGICIKTIGSHLNDITNLAAEDGVLVSSSLDSKIKIWDIDLCKFSNTLEGHKKGVSGISIAGNTIVSCSFDKTIKVWDIETSECKKDIDVNFVAKKITINDDKIIASSSDGITKLINIESGILEYVLEDNIYSTTSIFTNDGRIVSWYAGNEIIIKDAKSGKWLKTISSNLDTIVSADIFKNKIVIGSIDKTISLVDMETGDILTSFVAHDDEVTSLILNNEVIISGSRDGSIKIWDIESNECIEELLNIDGLYIENCEFKSVKIKNQKLFKNIIYTYKAVM